MQRWPLRALVLCAALIQPGAPASAADAPAAAPAASSGASSAPLSTGQDKLQDLGDYSLALGRKFGCDGKSADMVFDIKRFTYVLQFADSDGAEAQTIAKKNLTDGIGQTKADQSACPTVADRAADIENAVRKDRPLMLAAGHNVALVSGAAMACDVPNVETALLQPAMTYTHNDGDDAKPGVTAWLKEGRDEVQGKKIGCDVVKTIFEQVKTIFTP